MDARYRRRGDAVETRYRHRTAHSSANPGHRTGHSTVRHLQATAAAAPLVSFPVRGASISVFPPSLHPPTHPSRPSHPPGQTSQGPDGWLGYVCFLGSSLSLSLSILDVLMNTNYSITRRFFCHRRKCTYLHACRTEPRSIRFDVLMHELLCEPL